MITQKLIIVLGYPVKNCLSPGSLLASRLEVAFTEFVEASDALIIVTGGSTATQNCTEAEVMKEFLLKKGVAMDKVILENKSLNTFQNAAFAADIVKEIQYRELTLITSDFHRYRAEKYFSLFFKNYDIVTSKFPDSYPLLKRMNNILREKLAIMLMKTGLLNRAKQVRND